MSDKIFNALMFVAVSNSVFAGFGIAYLVGGFLWSTFPDPSFFVGVLMIVALFTSLIGGGAIVFGIQVFIWWLISEHLSGRLTLFRRKR